VDTEDSLDIVEKKNLSFPRRNSNPLSFERKTIHCAEYAIPALASLSIEFQCC